MCAAETLDELKRLAEDDIKYVALLKDVVSLQGLVLLLSNSNSYIVKLVLQILITLSKRPGAKSQLRALVGLQEELKRLSVPVSNQMNPVKEVCQLAEDLLIWLFQIEEKPKGEIDKSRRQTSVDPSRFRPKCVILQLYGLRDETDIDAVCSRLLTVRGVVSITFQLSKRRVLVCTIPELNPELLIQAVSKVPPSSQTTTDRTTYLDQPKSDEAPVITAQIVRKKNRIQSICRSNSRYRSRRGPHPFKTPNPPDASTNLPSYLDEDADLFEVDESKAAPKLKNQSPGDPNMGDTKGPISWLSEFLERSLFW